jgi:hypothetical protein
MIHVVFQQADVAVLKAAIALDESLAGDVLEIKDDFAVGPLGEIDTDEGWKRRHDWWQELLQVSPYQKEERVGFDDRLTVQAIRERLEADPAEVVWIWMGQNAHDVCGYFWMLSLLKDHIGRLFILYLNNLPFINEKGFIFYPTALHQIQPKEFLKAKKLNRRITVSEGETDPDEWNRLVRENAMVRMLEGGKKIRSEAASFYDGDILKGLTGEEQKGNRAMHNILAAMKIKTGDVFLLWRMQALALEGKVEIIGDPAKGWKEFSLRLKTDAPTLIDQTETP